MLGIACISFEAKATEYRDCPPDVCKYSFSCNKCEYNEDDQVIVAGYLNEEDDGVFHAKEYRKYDNGKLVESYTYNNYDDPIVIATQYVYNDVGQLVQENSKSEYYEDDFRDFNVSDYTYGNISGSESTYSYNYDNTGHLTEEYSNGQLAAKYSYEDGHLAAKVLTEGDEFSLTTYDAEGNQVSKNYFHKMYGSCENSDDRFEFSCRKDLGNGKTLICVGEVYCEQYYIEDSNGNLSECDGFLNALLGITIADEEAANRPQSTRISLADGSTKVIDPEGKVHYEGKRIYTVQEANEVVGKTNTIKLRYK